MFPVKQGLFYSTYIVTLTVEFVACFHGKIIHHATENCY